MMRQFSYILSLWVWREDPYVRHVDRLILFFLDLNTPENP